MTPDTQRRFSVTLSKEGVTTQGEDEGRQAVQTIFSYGAQQHQRQIASLSEPLDIDVVINGRIYSAAFIVSAREVHIHPKTIRGPPALLQITGFDEVEHLLDPHIPTKLIHERLFEFLKANPCLSQEILRLIPSLKSSGFGFTPELIQALTGAEGSSSPATDLDTGSPDQLDNISRMLECASEPGKGFDMAVIVTESANYASFWRGRIESTKGQVLNPSTELFVTHTPGKWIGKIGQALAIMDAARQVNEQLEKQGRNLYEEIKSDKSIAFYNTIGQGTRVAPLPGVECNLKGAVCLPATVSISGHYELLTMLESVIQATQIYAATRGGRICVFWTDHFAIPSADVSYDGKSHLEILAVPGEIPQTQQAWKERFWDQYGLLIFGEFGQEGTVKQREKQSWQQLMSLKGQGLIDFGKIHGVISLGSFTISLEFFVALQNEFALELEEHIGYVDTDPHLWQPMTSAREEYLANYTAKAQDDAERIQLEREAEERWERANKVKQALLENDTSGRVLFGCCDLGLDAWSWDYGKLIYIYKNLMKMVGTDREARGMRMFYRQNLSSFTSGENLVVEHAIYFNSDVKSGRIRNCIVVNTNAQHLDAENSIVIGGRVYSFICEGSIAYRPLRYAPERLFPGEVIADVVHPSQGVIYKCLCL
jgi:hypothetical protein